MKFNLNRDFHGEINFFPSLFHQYKMIGERILPPLNETGLTVDLQHPFKTQQRSTQRHHFPSNVSIAVSCSVAFISCALSLISLSEHESISVKATHNHSFGLL